MTMLSLIKSTDDMPPVIHEVGWRLRKPITPEAYRRDVAYAGEMGLNTYWWSGEDRNGRVMSIAWITTGERGALLSAYEIQEA
ncbi:hypothetical protein [Streptomyces rochei]|uniref:hypothetical protein n=1 Tax=Streptomyces rochei TaxID=1928 RepID=UPI0036FB6AD7